MSDTSFMRREKLARNNFWTTLVDECELNLMKNCKSSKFFISFGDQSTSISFWISFESPKFSFFSKMSVNESSSVSNESNEIAKDVVNDLLETMFTQVTSKTYKLKNAALYYDSLKQALQDILNIYDKPKPRIDHSLVIEAWKRDKPAKPSPTDSLIRNLL